MTLLSKVRHMLGRAASDHRHRLLALRQLAVLGRARDLLPGDPVLEREYRRVEEVVRKSGLRE